MSSISSTLANSSYSCSWSQDLLAYHEPGMFRTQLLLSFPATVNQTPASGALLSHPVKPKVASREKHQAPVKSSAQVSVLIQGNPQARELWG